MNNHLTFQELFKQELLNCYSVAVSDQSELIYEIYTAHAHSVYAKGFRFMTYQRINRHIKSKAFLSLLDSESLFYKRGYKKEVFTRGYKPTTKLTKCFTKCVHLLDEQDTHDINDINVNSKIASRRKDGARSNFCADVTNGCRVDIKGLKEKLRELQDELEAISRFRDNNNFRDETFLVKIDKRIEQLTSHRNHALSLFEQATDKDIIAYGWLPLKYKQVGTGRVYATGTSLQNAPSAIRKAALGACYEYDIENCHYEFLRQKSGIHLPYIQQYCANKSKLRNDLARELNLPVKVIKIILLSLIYGANATIYLPNTDDQDASAISDICGDRDTFYRVIKNHHIAGIRDEIKSAANILIEQNKHNGRLSNAMNIYYTGKNKWSKKLAHILQGLEAKALEAVVNITGNDTMLLLHDGIYTYGKWNNKDLATAIRAATGCKINVSEESTLAKLSDDEESATDQVNKGLDENEHVLTDKLDEGLVVDKMDGWKNNLLNYIIGILPERDSAPNHHYNHHKYNQIHEYELFGVLI